MFCELSMESSKLSHNSQPMCLREAIKFRNYHYLEQYLANGSNIYTREIDTMTPLQIAIQENDIEMVRFFLERKADPNQCYLRGNWECCSPLDYALSTKSHKISILLIQYGANIYVKSYSQVPTIFMAITHNQVRVVRYLMRNGVNPNLLYKHEHSLLTLSLLKGNVRIVKCILSYKPSLDLPQNHQSLIRIILLSRLRTSKRLVKMLYKYGLTIQYSDIHPEVIRKSIIGGHPDAVQNLLNLGVSPNFGIITDNKTKKTTSILQLAVEAGEIEIVKLLLKHGANIHLRDPTGKTPLLIAAAQNNLGMIRILLRNGANVKNTNFCGWSVLHYAIMDNIKKKEDLYKNLKTLFNRNKIRVIRLFLCREADLNAKTNFGSSPLHLAAEIGDPDVVRVLLDYGAPINEITALNRKTPMEIARDEANLQIVFRTYVSYLVWYIVNARKMSTLKVFQNHVYRLHQLELPIYPRDMEKINREQRWILDDYIKNEIDKEVDYLKKTKIGDTYVTLWRFITCSDKEAAKYINNDDVLTNLKHILRYPYHFTDCVKLVRNKLTIAKKINKLNRTTFKLLNFIFAEKNLPPLLDECVEQIMSHLNEKDRKIFVNGFVK